RDAEPERLSDGLLACEPGGEVLRRGGARQGVLALGPRGEHHREHGGARRAETRARRTGGGGRGHAQPGRSRSGRSQPAWRPYYARPVPRAVPLTPTVTWWPSTLYQTTTLELRRGADRLLVDPGISPWEIDEVVSSTADPVTQVLVTHADWDHVMALGVLADAQVTASTGAAERIRSGEARASIEKESVEAYIPYVALDALHCEQECERPADVTRGPWSAVCRPGRGHTDDGLLTLFPEERILVIGDY